MTPFAVHVLQDKMGGITQVAQRLLTHGTRTYGPLGAVLVDAELDVHPRSSTSLNAESVDRVSHRLPRENLFHVLRRCAKAIPPGPGVVVAHDWLELATAHRHDFGRSLVQVLHGDMEYYYTLAERHEPVVDRFVCFSRACQRELRRRLPARTDDVRYVPYGIEVDVPTRQADDGALRLCFVGRMDHGHKGVLDLPLIDAALARRGARVVWTLVGAGPDEERLRAAWGTPPHVRWLGRVPNADVAPLLATQDVFVLPTRAEGFPVALVEAMAAGVVPVVSNIRSGIPQVVEPGETGFRPDRGDNEGFAKAIVALEADRELLETMSVAARERIRANHEVRACTRVWDELLHEVSQRPRRPWRRRTVPYGSRLDRPWLPNALVRSLRRNARPGGR